MTIFRTCLVALAIFPHLGSCTVAGLTCGVEEAFTGSNTFTFTPTQADVYTMHACSARIQSRSVQIQNGAVLNCDDANVNCGSSSYTCSFVEWTAIASTTYEIIIVMNEESSSGTVSVSCPTQTTTTTSTQTTRTQTTSTQTTGTTSSTATTTSSTATTTSSTATTTSSTATTTSSTATTTSSTATTTSTTSTLTSVTLTSATATITSTTSTPTSVTLTSVTAATTTVATTSAGTGGSSSPASNEVGGCMTLTYYGANVRALIAAYRKTIARAANVDEAMVEVTATRGSICASVQGNRRLQENQEQVAMVFVIRYPASMAEAAAQTRNNLATIPAAEVERILAEEVSQVDGLDGQVSVSSGLITGSVEIAPVNEVNEVTDVAEGMAVGLLVAVIVVPILVLCACGFCALYWALNMMKKKKAGKVAPAEEPAAEAKSGGASSPNSADVGQNAAGNEGLAVLESLP